MPPKKGSKGKKKVARNSSDEDEITQLNQIDVQYNPEIVNNLLEDLSLQVEVKCNQIQKDADFMITSIQQAFHLELIKLPSQVKQMSIKRFKEEFGDSLEAVTRGAMVGPLTERNINDNSNKNKTNHKVFQTPSHHKQHSNVPSTSLRQPKEGEFILSANGSPLGEFTTVKKAPKNTKNLIPPTPGVFVPLSTGEIIDLEDADIENMSQENKADALNKMQNVMSNMQALMAKLSQPTKI